MAGVRDPAFWKRFSMAVHLDEETGSQRQGGANLKTSDSWLARQERKRSRRTCICCLFWLCFAIIVAGVVGTVLYLVNNGTLGGSDEDGVSKRLMR